MLDVTSPNQLCLATGMGKTRNEVLADYYLKAAGIAAIAIDFSGEILTQDVVGLEADRSRIVYCCTRGDHLKLAAKVQRCAQVYLQHDQLSIASRLEQLAEDHAIGLTPHGVAVQRALAAVQAVNDAIDRMQHTGGMKDLNRAFKAARKVDPSLRYFDYLHAHKAAMLEALARETN